MRPRVVGFVVPFILAAIGALFMLLAVRHYERSTGREFYGLAGYHYSMPEWGFAYHPDGRRIEEWTVTYPCTATSVALLGSLAIFAIRERRSFWALVGVVLLHLVAACVFLLFAALVSFQVTGVFI